MLSWVTRLAAKCHPTRAKRLFLNRSAWPWKTLLQRRWSIATLFLRQRCQLIRHQLPSRKTLYPNVGAAVLAAGRLTTVLSLNGDTAGRHGAVLINAHGDVFFFPDRVQRGCAGFNVLEPLCFREHIACGGHKHIIVCPDFLQRRSIAF